MTSTLLQQKLDALLALHPKVIDLSLGRLETLLKKLGNPEKSIPPVIHIAGTNGKGSTTAFLRAMLEAAGKRVHTYTSPHLVRFNERIVCKGAEIDDARLIAALDDVARVNNGDPITYFEITTAAAFLLFRDGQADVLLLEVGLGGRLDATNVIDTPLASVITPISFDHQDYLGDTLQQIAAEKAGIIKQGVVCISSPQKPPVRTVLAEKAIACDAPLIMAGLDFSIEKTPTGFVYRGTRWKGQAFPPPALYGDYQYANAATAIATLEQLPTLAITLEHIAQGLTRASWPARMQKITTGALRQGLADRAELWLDGSHNEGGAVILAETLAAWQQATGHKTHLILGMLQTKSVERFIAAIKPYIETVHTVPIPRTPKAYSPEDLAAVLGTQGVAAVPMPSVPDALERLASQNATPIIITGSLYLAGVVLEQNGS